MNIYMKLVEVRETVKYLQKNEQGPQFKFVSSRQVLESVREKMNELNLLLIPRILSHYVTTKEKQTSKGSITSEYFTELDIEFTWINAEDPKETIVIPWYSQGIDTAGEKGVGKALTYAEKYFLLKQFNIPTDKDDPDSVQSEKVEKEKPKLKRYSPANQQNQSRAQEHKQTPAQSQTAAKDRWIKAINDLNAFSEQSGLTREELRKKGTEVTGKNDPKHWSIDDMQKIRKHIESYLIPVNDEQETDNKSFELPPDDELPF